MLLLYIVVGRSTGTWEVWKIECDVGVLCIASLRKSGGGCEGSLRVTVGRRVEIVIGNKSVLPGLKRERARRPLFVGKFLVGFVSSF